MDFIFVSMLSIVSVMHWPYSSKGSPWALLISASSKQGNSDEMFPGLDDELMKKADEIATQLHAQEVTVELTPGLHSFAIRRFILIYIDLHGLMLIYMNLL